MSQIQTTKILNYIKSLHTIVCRNDSIFIKDFWPISSLRVIKYLGTSKLYTTDALKALLSKNKFYFFFLIFWREKLPPSLLIFNFTTLSFSNLLCEAKNLIRIIISGSFSSKFLSRLILSIFTVRIPILLQQIVTSQESSHKKSKPSSEYKAV